MYDLVVLGGGAGGLSVATAAATVGARVALIEASRLGGESTLSAFVPSKVLIEAAGLAHRIRHADRLGLAASPAGVDFAAVMGRARDVADSLAGSDAGALQSLGVEVIRGRAAFEAYDTVVVDGTTRVNGRAFVIATGSRPALPAIEGLEAAGPLTTETVWALDARPASMAVIGGDAVGVELAQAMARLGVEVTLIESGPGLLPGEDPEAGRRLRGAMEAEGIKVFTNAEISRVEARGGAKVVHFVDRTTRGTFEAAREALLVASGRRANVEGLNLEAVGIEADPDRGIPVDDSLQTYARNIYAIGDVIGRHRWAHAADREAAVAFQNAVLRIPKKMNYDAMPRVAFTDPEFAAVGRSHGFDPADSARTFRVEYGEPIDGRPAGIARVAATPSGKILGATILGDNAALALQGFVAAMEHGLSLQQILNTAYPDPTLAVLARALSSQLAATRLEGGLARVALRLVYGFEPPSAPGRADGEPAGESHADPIAAGANGQGHGH